MSGSLGDKLAAAAEAGYDGVEIFENDLTYFDGSPEDVRALAASLGLEIVALQPFRDFEGLPEPLRARAFDRARRKFELMDRLGTQLLLVCSSVSPDAIDDMARVAADLHELGELAQAHGITVGFEALCWGRHINDYRQAWEAVRRADHPHVGLILDTFHALARKCPIDAIADIPAERIVLVQTADAPGDRDGPPVPQPPLPLLPRPGRPAGGGDDARSSPSIGYDGPISHEIFSDDFRAGSATQVAIDGMRSFLWLEEQLGRARRPGRREIDGVEFIEFVDDRHHSAAFRDDAAAPWASAAPTATAPRTSSCTARASINLVLNLEDEGFAALVPAPARALGGGAGAAGRRCRPRAARTPTRLLAKPFAGPDRRGRARDPGRARRRRQPALLRRRRRPSTRRSPRSTSCPTRSPGGAGPRPARDRPRRPGRRRRSSS